MKNKSIFWVLFFVVLAIILFSGSIFKTNEVKLSTLSIKTINTEIIVKDEIGNILLNNSQIEVGEDYTITFIESADYVLETFKINNVDYVNNIENNQYTFTCTGSTTIYVSSIEKQGGDILPDLPPVDETKYSVSYISLNRGAVFNSINAEIDLVVYDSNNNFFTRLTPGDYFYAPENSNFNIKFDIKTPSCVVSGLTYTLSTGLFASHYAFPIVIENISQDMNIYVHYYSARIDTTYSVEAGIPVQVQTLGGDITNNFVVGEQYTIIDTCNPGYEAVVKVNNEPVTLPYTFIYAEDIEIEISADPITITPNVTAENCTYSFTNANTDAVTQLTFGETYTLSATANENYIILNATFNNEQVTLPYTFVASLNNEIVITTAEIVPYTPEVTAINATYSFTNENSEVVTELVLGTTYTLSAEPNQYYNLKETTFNGEVITLPYTFVAGETAQVVINTIGMTVVPEVTSTLTSYHFEDLEGNTVTELTYGQSYNLMFEPVLYYTWYLRDSSKQLDYGSCYSADFETYNFTCADTAIFNLQKGAGVAVNVTFVCDEGAKATYMQPGWNTSKDCTNKTLSVKYNERSYASFWVKDGYKQLSLSLNGKAFTGSVSQYKITSIEDHVFEIKTEKITTSNMIITYTGLPTDYKVCTEVVMLVTENEEDGYLKVGSTDSSTSTTLNLSEYIDTYSYFILQIYASDLGSDITSQYKVKSAKLNGSSITFTADENGLYVYNTVKPFPTTETYTLEITFTAVS